MKMTKPSPRELATGSGFGKGYDYPPRPGERWRRRLQTQAKQMAQRLLRAVLGTLGQLDAWLHRWQPRPPLVPPSFHPRRILVIRTDLLGDVVLTLPTVHALRRAYPQAEITMVVLPANAALVRDQPDIDRVVTCDPNAWLGNLFNRTERQKILATMQELRRAKYDLAVSVCGDWASIVARLAGATRRVGFAGEAYAHFLTDPVPGRRFALGLREHEYGLLLAAHAGGIVDPPGSAARLPHLRVSEAAHEAVQTLLVAAGIPTGQAIVALHAGSGNGQAKRWPLPAWARLADQLIETEGVAVVLIGAPGDKPLAQSVLRRMRQPARAIDLTGKTSLPELAALLATCAVVVTGDSGPLHVAEAVGTRVVAIHGPTDPAQSGPCHPTSIVLWRHIWCAPCYDSRATAECRFGNPLCIKGITPAEVLAATQTQLGAVPPASR
jgi:lipopolysaccharide heptosyltransferase II